MMTTRERIAEVTLREDRAPDGEVSLLEACVEEGGDLVIEGCDLGKTVKEVWGDSDYEYWRRVKREHVPTVLLQLIKERFSSDVKTFSCPDHPGLLHSPYCQDTAKVPDRCSA